MPATYPAVTFEQAVDLVEQDVNIFHDILNGDDTTSVPIDVGTVPSVRKALADMAAYKVPLAWANGVEQTDFLQPRIYSNGFYIPVSVPITMGAAPDSNWKFFSYSGEQFTDPGWSSTWQSELNLLSDNMAVVRAPSTTFSQYTDSLFICNNCYFDGTDWRRITGEGGGFIEIGEQGLATIQEFSFMAFNPGTAGGIVTLYPWGATESQSGPMELATQAEVDAGTDDTKAVTPLKLANAVGNSPAEAGFASYTTTYINSSGVRNRLHFTGGSLPADDTWVTVGPTGSGANHILSDLDNVPTDASVVKLSGYLRARAASETTSWGLLYARPEGSAAAIGFDTERAYAYFQETGTESTLAVATSYSFDMPIGSNRIFSIAVSGETQDVSMYVEGFGR